jgi:hypothetical protein
MIEFRGNLPKLKNALLTRIMNRMLVEMDMLCMITATNRAFRPINARLIISENGSRIILLEDKKKTTS